MYTLKGINICTKHVCLHVYTYICSRALCNCLCTKRLRKRTLGRSANRCSRQTRPNSNPTHPRSLPIRATTQRRPAAPAVLAPAAKSQAATTATATARQELEDGLNHHPTPLYPNGLPPVLNVQRRGDSFARRFALFILSFSTITQNSLAAKFPRAS